MNQWKGQQVWVLCMEADTCFRAVFFGVLNLFALLTFLQQKVGEEYPRVRS